MNYISLLSDLVRVRFYFIRIITSFALRIAQLFPFDPAQYSEKRAFHMKHFKAA